jgi:SAM-dependent methyltransferase
MADERFDVEAVFDVDDYLYFYGSQLTAERTEREVERIWQVLNLQPGMEVLDLACGHGRIANQLAARGCAVTGIDVTAGFLDVARRDAAALGVSVDYVEGDMRALPWTDRFDRIVNWFTAYGYFDDEGNRAVLREAYRALKPGGELLIEHINRDAVLRNLQQAHIVERDGNYMLDESRYDVLSGRIYTGRITIRDGRTKRMQFFVRLFSYPEVATWLRQAGFAEVQGYDPAGEALKLDSGRMIVVARK